jgi:hypothetical protein
MRIKKLKTTIPFIRISILLLLILITSSCSLIDIGSPSRYCNSDLAINNNLTSYISDNFSEINLPRLGIIPFSVASNLAGLGDQRPSLGIEFSRKIQERLLAYDLPISIEQTNWNDWAQQKEDFYKGNFLALQRAKLSGYTLILVGLLEEENLNFPSASYKIIDVLEGVTVISGRTKVNRNSLTQESGLQDLISSDVPNDLNFTVIYETLATCISSKIAGDKP